MMYTRFYDHVLTEIEAGKVHDGINLLVGMLDAVGLQPGSLAQARHELRSHNLSNMLSEDPLIAHAEALPHDPAQRIRMLSRPTASNEISSTGRRLFEATSDLTFARGIRQRRASFDLKLSRAVQQGQRIGLLDRDGANSLRQFESVDISNITLIDVDDVRDEASFRPRFDQILAPDLLDRHAAPTLITILERLRASLVEQGSIVVAALLPKHLGAGWRSACLNWNPHCHDEAALASIATSAGLIARTYRDESGCIVWAELKPVAHFSGSPSHED